MIMAQFVNLVCAPEAHNQPSNALAQLQGFCRFLDDLGFSQIFLFPLAFFQLLNALSFKISLMTGAVLALLLDCRGHLLACDENFADGGVELPSFSVGPGVADAWI